MKSVGGMKKDEEFGGMKMKMKMKRIGGSCGMLHTVRGSGRA
jgi:hypothetical protein